MPLSPYKIHKIYLAATMNFALGSDYQEEIDYYNKIRKDIDNMKNESFKKGIAFNWDLPKRVDK